MDCPGQIEPLRNQHQREVAAIEHGAQCCVAAQNCPHRLVDKLWGGHTSKVHGGGNDVAVGSGQSVEQQPLLGGSSRDNVFQGTVGGFQGAQMSNAEGRCGLVG